MKNEKLGGGNRYWSSVVISWMKLISQSCLRLKIYFNCRHDWEDLIRFIQAGTLDYMLSKKPTSAKKYIINRLVFVELCSGEVGC